LPATRHAGFSRVFLVRCEIKRRSAMCDVCGLFIFFVYNFLERLSQKAMYICNRVERDIVAMVVIWLKTWLFESHVDADSRRVENRKGADLCRWRALFING
jgi:hypothetical protein